MFGDRLITEAVYGVSEDDAHRRLVEIAKTKPDIIFTVNSRFGRASLQTSLELSDVLVFNCNHTQPGKRLNTYYCKLYELTFMLGILAGSYTSTNTVGFIHSAQKPCKLDLWHKLLRIRCETCQSQYPGEDGLHDQ